ncbi:hypothetical protein [Mycoplasmopsis edwardii]|uniref:hypothetical protein n=1 Tax=Mycoplasmopsis edwardii TaxID=53558 RepID=UPI00147327FD|nr:hypothetical protein [Mycoplasmopsis edwardii]
MLINCVWKKNKNGLHDEVKLGGFTNKKSPVKLIKIYKLDIKTLTIDIVTENTQIL